MTITASSTIKKLLILLLVFTGLYFAKKFLIPLSIGGVLATLFLPFCKKMEGKKISKGLAVFICLLVLLFVIVGVGTLLGWQISELAKDFAIIKQKLIETVNYIQEYIFKHLGVSLAKQDKY